MVKLLPMSMGSVDFCSYSRRNWIRRFNTVLRQHKTLVLAAKEMQHCFKQYDVRTLVAQNILEVARMF